MAEEIKRLHIFAELEDGSLRQVLMTEDETTLWFDFIGRYYDGKLKLAPIDHKITLFNLKSKPDGKEKTARNKP